MKVKDNVYVSNLQSNEMIEISQEFLLIVNSIIYCENAKYLIEQTFKNESYKYFYHEIQADCILIKQKFDNRTIINSKFE